MTIIKKFEPDIEKSKFPKFWVGMVIVFLLSLSLIEIWVNNVSYEYGMKFEKMTQVEKQLLIENQILENEIARSSSLQSISSKSAELGFSRPKKIQYIR